MTLPATLEHDVAVADVVIPEGARTQWAVGGSPGQGTLIAAPAERLRHDPADLTVSVDAGVSVGRLRDALADAGQECPIDARSDEATLGGVFACGLSGHRRLRDGPLRDRVLEVEFVLGDGRRVRGGGPTVKNVTGFDLPRLLVGSLGTLGLMTRFTLRCVPAPSFARWATTTLHPDEVRRRLSRPACIAWDGSTTWCLVEGHAVDVDAEMSAADLVEEDPPTWPDGPFRGRISVRPRDLASVGELLTRVGDLRWLGEAGVGTIHVASDEPGPLRRARQIAADAGGWLLAEAGEGVDPLGRPLPNDGVMRRLKEALDPAGKMNPGRLGL